MEVELILDSAIFILHISLWILINTRIRKVKRMVERLLDYKRKCKVLKQIQSNKARRYRGLNYALVLITIFLSAFITFIGFSGAEKIREYLMLINNGIDIDISIIQMVYNLLVFLLFFVVVFHLVFQFNSKQTDSEKSISLLSSLINEIDDFIENPLNHEINFTETLRYKYNIITQIISPNTDRQYLKAKKSLYHKAKDKKLIERQNLLSLSIQDQKDYIIKLIERNSQVQNILNVLKEENENLYMGGGIIRNIVWDDLHNYTSMTPIEDVDVIYFDNLLISKQRDVEIEERLKRAIPNLKWSVKNQARMHVVNNDEPYVSLEDAVSKWPETVSAILMRKGKDGKYEFIAPYYFDDLFRLIVQPTPHFLNKLDRYKERIKLKKWEEKWGKLKIFYKE